MPDSKIILTGTNFTGATAILFNGASAAFTNALTNNFDLRITAVVPPDATSGPITIVTPHGNVTSANNFEVLPLPLISVAVAADGRLILSWPGTLTGFVLESTVSLSPANWQPAAEASITSSGRLESTVSANAGQRYFRLRKP